MAEIISCCGVVCSACESFPHDCGGCPAIKGKAYWLEYVGAAVCPIYGCCVLEKEFKHCGLCGKMPCEHYSQYGDPTKTEVENIEIERRQIELLRSLPKE